MRGAALVTGAGKRIGKALALALGAEGYPILVHYRGESDDADAVAQAIKAAGGQAASVEADLADRASVATLIDRAAQPFGPLIAARQQRLLLPRRRGSERDG